MEGFTLISSPCLIIMATYEKTVTRKHHKEWLEAWIKAEASLGLKNSFFLIEDGMVTQFVDSDEAKKFYEYVKNMSEEVFENICDDFFKAIEEKDKYQMFKALTIFDEMDNYDLGTESMKRRLKRVRESTHEISYKI